MTFPRCGVEWSRRGANNALRDLGADERPDEGVRGEFCSRELKSAKATRDSNNTCLTAVTITKWACARVVDGQQLEEGEVARRRAGNV